MEYKKIPGYKAEITINGFVRSTITGNPLKVRKPYKNYVYYEVSVFTDNGKKTGISVKEAIKKTWGIPFPVVEVEEI